MMLIKQIVSLVITSLLAILGLPAHAYAARPIMMFDTFTNGIGDVSKHEVDSHFNLAVARVPETEWRPLSFMKINTRLPWS